MHSLSANDGLSMDARVTLDGVPQDACTYASEHAGYVRRLVTRDGRLALPIEEEVVIGDVQITFPGLTPEQVERLSLCRASVG